MSEPRSFLHRRTLCVLTGASRGIGATIASELSRAFAPGSHIVLIARDAVALADVAKSVDASTSVSVVVCDLTDCRFAEVESNVRDVLASAKSGFECALLVQNAGSLSDVRKRALEHTDAEEIARYWALNVTSFVLLNSLFVQLVRAAVPRTLVVNMTSLAAIVGMPSLALYCAGKAARDAYMRSLAAEENSDKHDLRLLSYAPGPVDTDMSKTLGADSWSEGVRTFWKESFAKPGAVLTPVQTVSKLLRIVDEDKFENGAHVDYMDKE